MRDQLHSEDLGCELFGFVGRFCQLDATTLATSASMDLRFYDNSLCPICQQTLGDFKGLIFGISHLAARHRHAIPRKNAFGLILVNFHSPGVEEGRNAQQVPTS